MMNRRDFARSMAETALAASLPALSSSASNTAPASASFKFSMMLWTFFRDLPFEQRLEKAAQAGYHAVELVNEFEKWSDGDFLRANARKRSLGITFDATAGVRKGIANPAARDAFLADLYQMLVIAGKLECPAVIVLSGDKIDGLSPGTQHQSCIDTLKRAAELADKQQVTLLLENIDSEENPTYYLTSVAEGFEIVRAVNHPNVKFLYDFYHEQISEGNLIEKLEKNIEHVGLVHIADVPGRHEPGTGEINYPNIFRKLAQLNYTRYVAMEFIPSADPVATLRAARQMAMQSASSQARRSPQSD
jgi:hydroxypyruvate isomerase